MMQAMSLVPVRESCLEEIMLQNMKLMSTPDVWCFINKKESIRRLDLTKQVVNGNGLIPIIQILTRMFGSILMM